MPDIEITEECHALIATRFLIDQTEQRLSNGNWRISIDPEAWQRLQEVRLRGESISDCIIRVIIITQLRRGLL